MIDNRFNEVPEDPKTIIERNRVEALRWKSEAGLKALQAAQIASNSSAHTWLKRTHLNPEKYSPFTLTEMANITAWSFANEVRPPDWVYIMTGEKDSEGERFRKYLKETYPALNFEKDFRAWIKDKTP